MRRGRMRRAHAGLVRLTRARAANVQVHPSASAIEAQAAWAAIDPDGNGIVSYEALAARFGLRAQTARNVGSSSSDDEDETEADGEPEDLTLDAVSVEQQAELLHFAGYAQERAITEKRHRDRSRAMALAARFAAGDLRARMSTHEERRRSSPAVLGAATLRSRVGLLPGVSEVPIPADTPAAAFLLACAEARHENIKAALHAGRVDVDCRDGRGETALHKLARAAGTGGLRTVRTLALLHQHGADMDARDMHGRTAAHVAAAAGSPLALCFLLSNGADPRLVDLHGASLLHVAASHARPTCVRVVLEADRRVDVNSQDAMGRTALHVAACRCPVSVLAALCAPAPRRRSRRAPARAPRAEALCFPATPRAIGRIRRGATPSIADARGLTPAHLASIHGSAEARAYLERIPPADLAAASEQLELSSAVSDTQLPPHMWRRRVTV